MNINTLRLKNRKLTLLLLVFAFTAISLFSAIPARAAVNASFTLSPATKTVTVGDNLVVYLNLNTGGNSVLAWKTTISYPTSVFNSVSVQTDPSSHFTLAPSADVVSGGVIKISRYAKTASSSNGTMAKITLHSKAVASGTLSFAHICSSTSDTLPCSTVVGAAGTNLLASTSNGTYTVAAVPIASSPSSPAATTKKKKSFVSKVSDAIASVISPGTSAEEPSNEVTTISRSAVRLTVKDKAGKPLSGAKVTLAGVSATTDKNGQVTLTELYPGQAKGKITYKDYSQNISLFVEPGTSASDPQVATFNTNVSGGSMWLPILFSIVALAVIAGLIDLIFISKGGFKENVDHLLHHGNGGGHTTATPSASSSATTKHTSTKSHERHNPLRPGLIVEPNIRGDESDWKR